MDRTFTRPPDAIDGAEFIASQIDEEELLQMVQELASGLGWIYYHTRDSRGSHPGYPDLTLARPPRIVWAELKSQKGRIRPAQKIWLATLKECGVEVYLWRPSDWEEIKKVLT